MRKLLLILPILCLPVFAAAPKKATPKKPAAKTATVKAAKSTTKSVKTTSAKTSSAKITKTSSKSKKKVVAPTRTSQQHPTSDRYLEIQNALVDRGYLADANGSWDNASIAAMKKFQDDQALHGDGKLTALSLTALGLGPRRGAFVVAPMVPVNSTVAAVE